MARYIYFIIFLLLLENNICEEYESKCDDVAANEQSECKDYLLDEEKEIGLDCCFVKFKKDGILSRFCHSMEKDSANDYKIYLQQEGKTEELKLLLIVKLIIYILVFYL